MENFWNMSTSIRNPERIPGLLDVASLLDGAEWNLANQEKFQILLIQQRKYLSEIENAQTFNNLSREQISWLKDKTSDMSYAQAESIFRAKNYEDPPMRGRQSMNPLLKVGLIQIVDGRTTLSDIGHKLKAGAISWEDCILGSLLKYQLPNPQTKGYANWNSKPFINTLRLIKCVNALCIAQKQKAKGISTEEFGIFALSLRNYQDIDAAALGLLAFRSGLEALRPRNFANNRDYETACRDYTEDYISAYLSDFKNPIKNVYEYGDSMKRYLRQTKYIRIIGKYAHQYIDLEPRRMIEIDAILQNDDGSCRAYSETEWASYMGYYGAYKLPFETLPKLTDILKRIVDDIADLETKLGLRKRLFPASADKEALKYEIEQARIYRTELQNHEIKFDYARDISKIDEAITVLRDIAANRKERLVHKLPVELEKWTNIALNIINDAVNIKPNAPVGDDNEPTFTAPANLADIECDYGIFRATCEVTMLRSRDQWFNEGQPVMRHLRNFENKKPTVPSYCLFIAPSLHEDTLETYWVAMKHGYKGERQKIVPMTILQLVGLLETVKRLKESNIGMNRETLMELYELCTDSAQIGNSTSWPLFIETQMTHWRNGLLGV